VTRAAAGTPLETDATTDVATDLTTDVAVIGGSLGGVAAALAALASGARVVLSDSTDWLGGQMTSQGVAALDEHPYIERFGGTRRYMAMRERVRRHYRERYGAPERMPDGSPLNPGNGWVSRLCFEPRVGVMVLEELLEPYRRTGQLTVLLEHPPVGAELSATGETVQAVTLRGPRGAVRVAAPLFLDATDLGDLLPLVGAPFVTGAEARGDTGEPSAPEEARPEVVQSFTFSFAVDYRPGENHTLPKPPGYERFRDAGLYTLHLDPSTANEKRFHMFKRGERGELPFWTYRRLLDASLLGLERDVALINWASNDYVWGNLLDETPGARERALEEAKAQALGFLYWLQTEAPRDEGGCGYPELRLRPDVMGTPDGLAKAPYLREGRRLVAKTRVTETHVSAEGRAGSARAHPFPDAVGIGLYPMDLHRCFGNAEVSHYAPTLPFQIPLGSLLPQRPANLLAACKNLGTTHLTNGCYRLHPVEWAVGEAAGTVAAYAVREGCALLEIWKRPHHLHRVQRTLLEGGAPLAWTVDVPPEHPLFVPAQLLVTAGALAPGTARFGSLELYPGRPLEGPELPSFVRAASRFLGRNVDDEALDVLVEVALDVEVAGGVSRAAALRALHALGVYEADLSDPPTWEELCKLLGP
jgi:hypothetical protein